MNRIEILKKFLVLIIIISSLFPLSLAINGNYNELSSNKKYDIHSLQNDSLNIQVQHFINKGSDDCLDEISEPNNPEIQNKTQLKFTISSQTGNGGGDITVYDSFNWTGTESLSTQNSIGIVDLKPTERSDSITISNPSDFTEQYKYFNLSNIKSEFDWRLKENYFSSISVAKNSRKNPPDAANGDQWLTIAISFEIKEDFINLTSVQTYTKNGGSGTPTGRIWIEGENSGIPNGTILSSVETLKLGNGWNDYSFDSEILLPRGTYFVVMNDTDLTPERYWEWWVTKDDAGDGNNNSIFALNSYGGAWWEANDFGTYFDAPLQIRVKVVEKIGLNWVQKKYNLNNDIKMWYNTTNGEYLLDSTDWFKANETSLHRLKSNISISFNLNFIANYTYTANPIIPVTTYLVNNDTISSWNLTYSITAINQSYQVKNRHIRLMGLKNDWNATSIYWNDSMTVEYGSLTNNVNITVDGNPLNKYTNGSALMYINASTLAENTTWHVLFEAPNYIYDFNLSKGGEFLKVPYEANVTDIININFRVEEPNGNISYWIEYYGSEIIKKVNFNTFDLTFFELWNLNASVSQVTNVNGTYDLQAFWMNTEKTKVGTAIRELKVFINTTMDVITSSEVLRGNLFNITTYFRTNHNSTYIKNAPIWVNTSWTTNGTMTSWMNGTYTIGLGDTDTQTPGYIGTVIITTKMNWYVNWTTKIYIKFVEGSILNISTASLILKWRENFTLKINYNDTSFNQPIESAFVTVEGTMAYNDSNNVYYFELNTTDFLGVGNYEVKINASHVNYSSQSTVLSLNIIEGETNVEGRFKGSFLLNQTSLLNKIYSTGLKDAISINYRYYSIFPNDLTLNNTPIINTSILDISVISEANNTWTISFNPENAGVYQIKVTFKSNNYQQCSFIFNFNVTKANVEIYTKESFFLINYSQAITLNLFVNNSDYNESIIGDILNCNDSNVFFENYVGTIYKFIFNASTVDPANYSILFTFNHVNFESSSLILVVTVVEMPTTALNSSPTTLLSLESNMILIEEDLEITIQGYETIIGQQISSIETVLMWMNNSEVQDSSLTTTLDEVPFSIIFNTIGWQYGSYNLTILIHTTGYEAQIYMFNVKLIGRNTSISLEIEPGTRIIQGDDITFIATLSYDLDSNSGFGAQQISLNGIELSFYIVLRYKNNSEYIFEQIIQTDSNNQATYIIDGRFTKDAVGFSIITINSASGLSALPTVFSMDQETLASYAIIAPPVNIGEIIIVVLTGVAALLIGATAIGSGTRLMLRRRKSRKQTIFRQDMAIEQSFEDIKSIRLIIARHESGLQFYSEKTIAEITTDTDALSGMSAALSSFLEEVSDSFRAREEESRRDKIEFMSREGLHMLIWHGDYSSLIIISEVTLPDYFQERLKGLGKELETEFEVDLQDFYSTDQIPSSMVKRMVRKHIPLHYFSAFVLNEGVLTLESIKMSKKENKMLKLVKDVLFEKKGVQYFFSEQIISHLSKKYKRSQAIEFLNKAIDINLFVECEQEDLIQLGQGKL